MDYLSIKLTEEEIPGAKLLGEVSSLSKHDAIRWLKCRKTRGLSKLSAKELREK